MRVLSSTYGSRGDVAPAGRVAVRSRAPGARVWACVPPDCAATAQREVPVAAGAMPNGVRR